MERDLPDLVDLMDTPVPDMLPLLWMLCLFIVKVNLLSGFWFELFDWCYCYLYCLLI